MAAPATAIGTGEASLLAWVLKLAPGVLRLFASARTKPLAARDAAIQRISVSVEEDRENAVLDWDAIVGETCRISACGCCV